MKMIKVTDPRPGDIGLTQISGYAGKLIEFGEWLNGGHFDQYQHAFIVLDGDRLIEAEPGGARMGLLSEYAGRDNLFLRPEGFTPAQGDVVAAAAKRYLGVGYSFADYVAIALHRFHVPAPGLQRYIASTHHMICSALVDASYQDAGYQLFDDQRWSGDVTPADLAGLVG